MKQDRETLIRAVAQMYYGHQMNTSEIGKEIGKSKMSVSRLLEEARTLGIVEIKVNSHSETELEALLRKQFHLNGGVRIAPSNTRGDATALLALTAADFIDQAIGDGESTIAFDGGESIRHTLQAMPIRGRRVHIYPLAWLRRSTEITYSDANVLVHYFFFRSQPHAKASWIPMPVLPQKMSASERQKELKKYLSNPAFQEIRSAISRVDIAVIGVGPIGRDSVVVQNIQDLGISYEQLVRSNAMGVIAGTCFNSVGDLVAPELEWLGVPLHDLENASKSETRRIICVAAGMHKLKVLRTILRRRLCNTLITDYITGSALID